MSDARKASTTTSVIAMTPSSSSVRPISCSPTGKPWNNSGSSGQRNVNETYPRHPVSAPPRPQRKVCALQWSRSQQKLNCGVGREEARGLTHLVHRLVLVVPELVRGHDPIQSPVDVRDREHGRRIVEVVAEARVEVVSVPCE